jgi:hexosaminidase
MPEITIVPRPESIIAGEGVFVLSEHTVIVAAESDERTARLLRASLQPATGFEFPIVREEPATGDVITLAVSPEQAPSAYRVTVTASGARLLGGDAAGLFHATQTFLQLLPPSIFRKAPVPGVEWAAPHVEIEDRPRFGWRGMLIDVSRHFFGRDAIIKLIDVLALHRLNVLHLHLTDDQGWRIQIRRYPLLTEIGSWRARSAMDRPGFRPAGQEPEYDHSPHDGYFTQEDLREIVAYAAARYVTVVPEIDIPGHSQAAIAAYPELGNTGERLPVWDDWGINKHILNVEDSTIEFYQNVLDEVMEIFPSEFIHIGGDECPKDEWQASPAAQERMRSLGLHSEEELQSWLTALFAEFLAGRGRRLVGWAEILEGGLPAGTTVMSWRGVQGGIEAAEAGHDVVMTPDPEMYLYHRQSDDPGSEPMAAEPPFSVPIRTVYDYDPVPAALSTEASRHVLGAQCQMWTEFVTSERQMHQMVFPRLCAFSEAIWRSGGGDFDDFQARLATHHDWLHAMGIDGFAALRTTDAAGPARDS